MKTKVSDREVKRVYERHESGESMYLLCKEYGVNTSYFSRAFKRLNLSYTVTRGRFNKNAHFFQTIDSEIKAYYLGLLFSDGYLSKTKIGGDKLAIRLNHTDGYILEPLRMSLCKDIEVTYFDLNYVNKVGKRSRQARYEICSSPLCNDLRHLGIDSKKSSNLNLRMPFLSDEDLNRHFIRGFFDGDGTAHWTGNSLEWFIVCTSKRFLEDMQKILSVYCPHELRFRLEKKTFDNHYLDQYYLKLNKREDILWLAIWLYQGSNYGLVRKLNRFKEAASRTKQYANHRCNKNLQNHANTVLTLSLKNEK